jgi:hypothetical protein
MTTVTRVIPTRQEWCDAVQSFLDQMVNGNFPLGPMNEQQALACRFAALRLAAQNSWKDFNIALERFIVRRKPVLCDWCDFLFDFGARCRRFDCAEN